jgi:hypothetical protein
VLQQQADRTNAAHPPPGGTEQVNIRKSRAEAEWPLQQWSGTRSYPSGTKAGGTFEVRRSRSRGPRPKRCPTVAPAIRSAQ